MAITGATIEVIRRLKISIQIDENELAEIFRQHAVDAINRDLESQGLPHRVAQADLKIELLANSYGDVQGAQAIVDKEIE